MTLVYNMIVGVLSMIVNISFIEDITDINRLLVLYRSYIQNSMTNEFG